MSYIGNKGMTIYLYTVGYTGHTPTTIKAQVVQLKAHLLDIRYSPDSRHARWHKHHLAELFGDVYHHVPELGNVNYKNGGPVTLANYEAGFAQVTRLLPQPIVLMCACKVYNRCHRKIVADRLTEDLEGVSIRELFAPPQLALF